MSLIEAEKALAKDPVCGMSVDPATAKASAEYEGRTYYFCCAGCRTKFLAEPHAFRRRRVRRRRRAGFRTFPRRRRAQPRRSRVGRGGQGPGLRHERRSGDGEAQGRARGAQPITSAARAAGRSSSPSRRRYVCAAAGRSRRKPAPGVDLHLPDASRNPPGRSRGRARSAAWRSSPRRRPLETGPNAELVDMTRRFWIALALAVPVVALDMGGHLPGVRAGSSARKRRTGSSSRWRRRSCCGPAGRSSSAGGPRSARATSTCSR